MWGNFPLPAELVVPPSELTQVSAEEWARVARAGELDEVSQGRHPAPMRRRRRPAVALPHRAPRSCWVGATPR